MTLIVQSIAAFLAICGFALLLEVPEKYLMHAGLTGAVCWFFYLGVSLLGHSLVSAAFLSSLVVAMMSHLLARILKAPVTLFLVPGILPTVPGASIYRSVYYMIQGQTDLANYNLIQTIQIAGAMALAIFIVDSIFRLLQKR